MQSYTEIQSSQSLQSSLALLLNNDKTALSQSAATAFPTTNLLIGMPCFRTDQNKLYVLKDMTPTWVMVIDLNAPPVRGVAQLPGGTDLNSVTTTGFYRLESFVNGPTAVGFGQLIVCAAGNDTVTQIYGEYTTGTLFTRSGNTALGGGAWSSWRKQWHDGHAGHGTGMNADMLDGRHADNASGSVPVSNGTLNTNLNADMVDGKHVGNGTGQVPVSNGTVNTNLNADMLDGFHAGSFVRTINGTSPDGSGNVTLAAVDLTSRVDKTGDTMTGDLKIYRSAAPTTGYLFLGNSNNRYLYYDGTSYSLPGAHLYVNGSAVWTNASYGTCAGYHLSAVHGGISSAVDVVKGGNITVDAYGRVTSFTAANCNCNCANCG